MVPLHFSLSFQNVRIFLSKRVGDTIQLFMNKSCGQTKILFHVRTTKENKFVKIMGQATLEPLLQKMHLTINLRLSHQS